MNNNKKYKKWSLGLVAPAFVLAPIAVVASCSSSGEEKPVYSVSFKQPTLSVEVNNKNVKPSKLSKEGFVQEIINNKANIFNIEDSSGKVTDDFLRENLVVGDITADDAKNTASAEVTLNNKNTDGGSESATITLTGFDYKDVDLTKLEYTIEFKDKGTDPQTIDLGKSDTSLDNIDESALVKLVLEDKIKEQILTITGTNAKDITNEVLENQILEIPKDSVNKNQEQGSVQFTLNVLNDGTKAKIEKAIIFTGFKTQTDTPPASPKYKITLKTTTPEKEYPFTGIESKLASSYDSAEKVRDLIISKKEEIFVLTGDVPKEESWWKEKLVISDQNSDDNEGKITFNLILNDSNTMDGATDSDKIINETAVVIKGFQVQSSSPATGKPTTAKTELSTVTLGLNGNRDEAKAQINEQWVFDHLSLLFEQGIDLIKNSNEIVDLTKEDFSTGNGNPIKIKFKLVENKWYDDQGAIGTNKKEFEIIIRGLSATATNGTLLKLKSANPLQIGLVDPKLAEKTYNDYKNDSANIFTKEFVFKYRKHLLTGDFSKIDKGTENDFLVEYPQNGQTPATFVKVAPDDSKKTIQITFKILNAKLVGAQADTEFTIVFNGLK